MASRNIVIKNNTRCFKSALQQSVDFSFLVFIMGLHFQKSYQNRVAHFRIFGVGELFIFTVSKPIRIFLLQVKSKVFFIQFIKKWVNSFFDDLFNGLIRQIHKQKVTKLGSQKLHICLRVSNMGSTIGHRKDYTGVGALRCQRHIPSKN